MSKLLPLVAVLLLPCLVIPASAHPGRTDAAGGHWNHQTGQYHYHHGYGEHQHSDMDGDGDLDCPYEFKDASTSSLSSSGSSKTFEELWAEISKTYGIEERQSITTYPTYDWNETKNFDSGYDTGFSDGSESGYDSGYAAAESVYSEKMSQMVNDSKGKISWLWIIPPSFLTAICFIVSLLRSEETRSANRKVTQLENDIAEKSQLLDQVTSEKDQDIQQMREALGIIKRQKNNLSVEYASLASQIDKLKAENYSLIDAKEKYEDIKSSQQSLIDRNTSLEALMVQYLASDPSIRNALEKIPKGTLLTPDGLPVEGVVTKEAPYGDFTVYISEYGSTYHRNRWCSGAYLKPVCCFRVPSYRHPCKRCAANNPIPPMPEWYADILYETRKTR